MQLCNISIQKIRIILCTGIIFYVSTVDKYAECQGQLGHFEKDIFEFVRLTNGEAFLLAVRANDVTW